MRSFAERFAEFLRQHRLPAARAVPPGFHPAGLAPQEAAFDNLLLATAPRAGNDLIHFLEGLRRVGLLQYSPPDLRELDAGIATDRSLLAMYGILEAVAAGAAGPQPEAPKKGP